MVILTGASGGIGEYIYRKKSKDEFVLGITNKNAIETLNNTKVEKIDLSNEDEILGFINKNKQSI